MIKRIVCIVIISLELSGMLNAQSHYPGQHVEKLKLNDTQYAKMLAFDLSEVRLNDGRFKENMERESHWIMSLKTEQLLHSFKTNAGIYAGREGGYMTVDKLGGWESLDCELRGHSTGHILSGLSFLYASTGMEKYRQKGDSLVSGLAEVQKTLDEKGYLSAYPQNLIDRNISGKPVWAPWYTLHKLFSGLIDQYLYCNNRQALEIAENMGNWAYDKLKPVTEEQRSTILRNEFGGINDSFYALYEITGNEKYKWLGEFFYHNEVLDPLMAEEDILDKKHANTYIPKLIGMSRNYEIEGSEKHREIADFFWNTVVDHHTFVTGSNSDKEKFFEPDHLSEHMTGYTGESCNVYNMLKLTRHLYAFDPEMKYVEYYEKALFNHILGQQDPDTGMISYFLPMMSGAHKVYSTSENSFWCCVGTGFENQSKYGEFIYYHNDRDVFVNLFIASQLNWKEKGLDLTMKTDFPKSSKISLTTNKTPVPGTGLNVKYPSWAKNARVYVNGKKLKIKAKPGSYITINKDMKKGDIVEIDFLMQIDLVSTPDNPDKVAITYGPIVLAGKMGKEGIEAPAPYSDPELYNDYFTYDYNVPESVDNMLNLSSNSLKKVIKPTDKKLQFEISGKDILLEPLYDIHGERYIVYWDLK